MAVIEKNFLDSTGLGAYDALIKEWANSVNQLGYKTILKSADGNTLNLYKKANAVLGTDTPDATVDLGSADLADQLDALAAVVGATWNSTTKVYSIALDNTFGSGVDTVVKALNELKGQINILNGNDTTAGSVAKSIKDSIGALDTSADIGIASKSGKAVTITGSVKEVDGIIAKGTNTNITLADVASTGAAEDVTTTVITDGAAENPQTLYAAGNVQGILEAIAQDLNALEDSSVVTVEKQTTAESGYAATYVIKQNNTQVGDKINIPLDYLVKGAEVKTVTTADTPYSGAKVGDKYIDFTINVKTGTGGTEEHLYIPVNDLMAAISGGTNAETTVAISASNEITVTINAIAASKVNYSNTSSGSAVTETVQAALARIDGDNTVTGSIKKAVKDGIESLNTTDDVPVATYTSATDTITLANGISEVDGVIAAGAGDGITISPIATSTINGLFS